MSKSKPSSILACITNQRLSAQTIEKAAQIAQLDHKPLQVLSIIPTGSMTAEECETLDFLSGTARLCNAELTVAFSDTPIPTAVSYIKKMPSGHIVTGRPSTQDSGFIAALVKLMPKLKISSVSPSGDVYDLICLQTPKSLELLPSFI